MDQALLHQVIRDRVTRRFHEKGASALDHEGTRHLLEAIFQELAKEGIHVPADDQERLAWEVFHDVFGFGAIDALMRDPSVTEIMVNGPFLVFAERHGVKVPVPETFKDERSLMAVIERLLALSPGKRLDQASPMADLALPDGSRIHVAIPPVVAGGPHVTIRKYVRGLRSLDDYVATDGMSDDMAAFLHACVRARLNILLAGGAGSGKTTLLEVLSTYLDPDERIVVIEDTLELHFRQPNVVRLLSRPPNIEGRGEVTITDLFRNSLRMRPTRIVLGEIRGREVLDFLNAVNSGHRGVFGVIHASSPEQAVDRLENLVPYSGVVLPSSVVRRQIANGLDLVVQHDQFSDGSRKITRLTEVGELEANGNIAVRDIFRYVEHGRGRDGRVLGEYQATGVVPGFNKRFEVLGLKLPPGIYEPDRG